MDLPKKTNSLGKRKVIFECTNNMRWAVCMSLKRNHLYYFNVITKESLWEKPDFLLLTEQEQKIIKSYEVKNGSMNNGQDSMNISEDDHSEDINKYKPSDNSDNSVSDKGHKKLNYFGEESDTKQSLKTNNLCMSAKNFKPIPFNYKSPLHNSCPQKSSINKTDREMHSTKNKLNKKSSIFNKLGSKNTQSVFKSYIPENKSANFEKSMLRSEECVGQSSSKNSLFHCTDILPRKSVVLENIVLSDRKPFQSPFQGISGSSSSNSSGVTEKPIGSVCRISNMLGIKCEDSKETVSFKFPVPKTNKNDESKNNSFNHDSNKLENKSCFNKLEDSQKLYRRNTSNNTPQVLDISKKKHRKKRQHHRVGYWLNKKAASDLKLTVINNSVVSNSLQGVKTEANIKVTDEDMEWEDSTMQVDVLSKISVLRSNPFEKEQQIINKDLLRCSPSLKPHLLIVLDTNVLLVSLRAFLHFVNAPPSEFPAAFVVPYGVLTDLDKLKDKEQSAFQKRLREVISLIQKLLLERHPRVIGQRAEDSIKQMNQDLDLTQVDDLVLNCCLQYQNEGFNVVLYTNNPNLMVKTEKLNIVSGGKKPIYKEIGILSVMKKFGILDELDELCHIKNQNNEHNVENNIPEYVYTMISYHLDKLLQEYLTTVLNKGMYKFYGAKLWKGRFILKPPWKIRELCVNLRQHWSVLTNCSMRNETIHHTNNVNRLMSNFQKVRWTDDTVGELLDSIKHITKHLEEHFFKETKVFNEHLKKCEEIFCNEMNKHTLLIRTPSEALSEVKHDIDSIFCYVITKLKDKSTQAHLHLSQFSARIDAEKCDEQMSLLQEILKEMPFYFNSVSNILKGLQGMASHQSMILSLLEPFVFYFMEGLQSVIMLGNISNPQSSVQEGYVSQSQITPQSVVDFFYKKKNSGLLPHTLLEVQTIHNLLSSFVCNATRLQNVLHDEMQDV